MDDTDKMDTVQYVRRAMEIDEGQGSKTFGRAVFRQPSTQFDPTVFRYFFLILFFHCVLVHRLRRVNQVTMKK